MRTGRWLAEIIRLPTGRLPADERVLRHEIEAAIRLIDGVHRAPDIRELPVRFTHEERYGGYQAESDRDGRHILISVQGPTPRLTFAHEIGHFLDDAIGQFEVYSSQEGRSPMLAALLTIRNSEAIQRIEHVLEDTRGEPSPTRFEALRLHAVEEQWARAYAQYITLRSDDETMRQQVVFRRTANKPLAAQEQWAADEFEPIAQAIDRLLRQQGWMP